MRRLFDRIPLLWKYLLMSLLIFVSFYASFYFFLQRVLTILNQSINVQVSETLFRRDFLFFFILSSIMSVFLLLVMYFD